MRRRGQFLPFAQGVGTLPGCGQFDAPLGIRLLKRVAAERGADEGRSCVALAPTGKRVAIVGAGPCGLTAAWFLALLWRDRGGRRRFFLRVWSSLVAAAVAIAWLLSLTGGRRS